MATVGIATSEDNALTDFKQVFSHNTSEDPIVTLTGNNWDYAVDNNSDGKYDFVVATFELNISQAGRYYMYSHYRALNHTTRSIFNSIPAQDYDVGYYNITIHVSNSYIHWHEGNITIYLDSLNVYSGSALISSDYTDIYFVNSYNRDDFASPTVQLLSITEVGIDLDNNSLYDVLQIDFTVNATEPVHVKFHYNFRYTNNSGYWYFNSQNNRYLSIYGIQLDRGIQNLSLYFSGKELYDNNFTGELSFNYFSCERVYPYSSDPEVYKYHFSDMFFANDLYPLLSEWNSTFSAINFTDSHYPLIDIKEITHFNILDGSQLYYMNDRMQIRILIEKFIPNMFLNEIQLLVNGKKAYHYFHEEEENSTHELWTAEFLFNDGPLNYQRIDLNFTIEAFDATCVTYQDSFIITAYDPPSIHYRTGFKIEPGTKVRENTDVNLTLSVTKGTQPIESVTVDLLNIGLFDLELISSTSTTAIYKYKLRITDIRLYNCTFFVTDSNGRTINYTKNILFTIEQIKLSPGFESPLLFLTMVCYVVYIKKSRRE
ncbi:MAG: hypothetical protein ACXAC6_08555 [Candidatus Hodarchaeales archaeon]|jgi:hypothetical protein